MARSGSAGTMSLCAGLGSSVKTAAPAMPAEWTASTKRFLSGRPGTTWTCES